MIERKATARWEGDLRTGTGTVRLGSGAFEGPYSFGTRFESAPGTNPEELLGAAHAGCFTMALSLGLTKAGHPPASLDTTAAVELDKTGDAFSVCQPDAGDGTPAGDTAGGRSRYSSIEAPFSGSGCCRRSNVPDSRSIQNRTDRAGALSATIHAGRKCGTESLTSGDSATRTLSSPITASSALITPLDT